MTSLIKNGFNKNEDVFILTNLELLSSYYPLFYLLELTLKERLYNQLKNKLGEDWFTKQLVKPDPLFEEERSYILRRKPKNFLLKDNGLLVESGLGFWVEFFNRRLYKEAKGIPISIFKNLPPQIKRKDIYQKLDRLKEFRNRLFHSRIPLVTDLANISMLKELSLQAKDLKEILNWFGELSESIIDDKHIQTKISELKARLQANS